MKRNILLQDDEKKEILQLKEILQKHLNEYASFKSFTTIAKEGLQVVDALINSDYTSFKKHALKYSDHTAEKMKGIQSLSTYKKTSSICNFLSMHEGICKKCYAEKSISLYKASLLPLLIYNTLLLKYIDIDANQVPYINNKYFRFEAFSDLQSSKHFKNLLTVCKKNKNTIFTLWTKAGYKLVKMIEDEKIKRLPTNLNIIASEFYLNKKTDPEYLKSLQKCLYPSQAVTGNYKNALKNFVVYNDEKLRLNSGLYLCKNKCVDCLKCYKKSKNIIYIAEKIH